MKKITNNKKNWKVVKQTHESSYPDFKLKKLKTPVFMDYVHDIDNLDTKMYEVMDNFVFEATVKFNSMYRGRSAAGFELIDVDDNILYVMRIKETLKLLQAIQEGRLEAANGGFTGVFTFVKQGSNYSLSLHEGNCKPPRPLETKNRFDLFLADTKASQSK